MEKNKRESLEQFLSQVDSTLLETNQQKLAIAVERLLEEGSAPAHTGYYVWDLVSDLCDDPSPTHGCTGLCEFCSDLEEDYERNITRSNLGFSYYAPNINDNNLEVAEEQIEFLGSTVSIPNTLWAYRVERSFSRD